MKKIICVGSATKDIFVRLDETKIISNEKDLTAKRLMAFEFGAKVYANDLREELGGGAVNIAAGLAKAEIKPFVFSRTSKTAAGKWILKKASALGIKKNYMQQTGGSESEISVIVSDSKNNDHVIFRSGDSVEMFDLKKAIKKFKEKVDWIYVSSQKKSWLENMNLITEFAKEKEAKIALNPSSWQISKDSKDLVSFFDKIEVLFLNRDEAIEIVKNIKGEVNDDPKVLLDEILSFGVRQVVLTDAAQGAYVADKDNKLHMPIVKTKIVETTGAGDAFTAGFLANFIETRDIKKALSWGIISSSQILTEIGGTKGFKKRSELKMKGEAASHTIKAIQ